MRMGVMNHAPTIIPVRLDETVNHHPSGAGRSFGGAVPPVISRRQQAESA